MSQPPKLEAPAPWRRPDGVAPGTWDYVHQRTIADHYDAFVAETPLCELDRQILSQWLPRISGPPQTVIDLGCGSGRTALPLAEAGYDVIGIDLSRSMLGVVVRKANDRPPESDLPQNPGSVSVVQANLVELECFADQIADHAVCLFSTLGMIQGRPNRRRMLSHAARIVRTGGLFVLHVHNRWAAIGEPGGLRALIRSRLASIHRRDVEFGDSTYAYRGIDAMFMHRFSRAELLADLAATGWGVESCQSISVDGSKTIGGAMTSWRAGGFVIIAKRNGPQVR